MIYRLMRTLTVSRRIFGGFLFLVMLFGVTVPYVLKNHQLLFERVKQVTDVDTKADRLLLLSSKRIESSRVNLMRFLQDYIPSAQASLNDVMNATRLLTEAEKLLTVQNLNVNVKQVIKTLADYEKLIGEIGEQRHDGKTHEITRLGFKALKAGNDIGLLIEHIVEENAARISDENRISDIKASRSFRRLLVYGACALIFGLILVAFVGRSITVPISELREAAESFQQGHTDFKLTVTGTDELSLLGSTFKQMTENLNQNKLTLQDRATALEEELSQRRRAEEELQRYQANLEELVKNRTEELSKAVDQMNTEIAERNKTEKTLKQTNEKLENSKGDLQQQLAKVNKTRKAMLNILEDLEISKKETESTMQKINVMSQAVYDALVMIDSRGEVQFWNQGATRLFGYTAQEAMGKDFHAMAVPPELREKANAGIRHFADSGKGAVFGATIETTAINRRGEIFPVEVNLSPFQVDKKWFAVGTVRDITERKEAENAIKESEKRVQTILDGINTGVVIIDPENRTIVDVNPVAAQMIGLPQEKIVGRICHQFICPKALNHCPVLDNDQNIENDERVLVTATGKPIPILKTVSHVNLSGKMHLLESFIDISERKEAEDELKERMAELERFSRLTVDRELKMIQLKEEINTLQQQTGGEKRYKIVA